jgi:hypothetical protein
MCKVFKFVPRVTWCILIGHVMGRPHWHTATEVVYFPLLSVSFCTGRWRLAQIEWVTRNLVAFSDNRFSFVVGVLYKCKILFCVIEILVVVNLGWSSRSERFRGFSTVSLIPSIWCYCTIAISTGLHNWLPYSPSFHKNFIDNSS